MELRSLFVVLIVVLVTQSRACTPNCASTSGTAPSNRVINDIVERVEVSDVGEAQWRGACHSFCITDIARHTITTSLPSWPAVLQVDTRCNRISNYLQCVEGCVSRRFLNPSLSNGQCQDDCFDRCNTTQFGLDTNKITSTCDLRCTQGGGGCKTGCRDSGGLTVSNDQLPAAPISSDFTLLTASTGSFLLDATNTQPTNTNVSSSVHSFVVRVDGDGITKNWWMRNFEVTELDLGEFVCKEVDISFAVISEHGVSDFSSSKRFCIQGANSTSQLPPDVNIVFEEKVENPRQEGLFTVNVSWTHPIDLMLSEVQYRVTIIGGSCNKAVDTTLPSNITSISESGFEPNCQVTVKVYTLFNDVSSLPNVTTFLLRYPVEIIAVSHTLEPDGNTGIYNFTVYFALPRRDPLLLATVLGFLVTHFKRGDRNFPVDLTREDVHPTENQFNYSKSFLFTPKDDSEVFITYVVTAQQAFKLQYRGRLRNPDSEMISYRGLPPSTVNFIDILNVTIDVVTDTIILNITWDPPLYPYGELQYYELLLTAENGTANYTYGGRVYHANATFGILNASFSSEVDTYLLQLYSTNNIGTSQPSFLSFNLSDYYVNVTDNNGTDNNGTGIIFVPPETAAVSEDVTTPTYAYYIIGIGSAVLLIALTLVVCCCVYTSYVKWNNSKNKLPPSIRDPWGPLYAENGIYKDGSISIVETRPSIVADAWEISPDHILLGKALGSGFFGEVYRCTIEGPITTPYTERNQLSRSIALPAAVKILKENATEKMHSDFIKEIELMKRAGENYNSHVVSMICCTVNQEPKALVLEYVEHGDLLQYLQKNKVFVLKNKMKEEPIDSNIAQPYLEPGDQYSHLAPRNMSSPYDHLRNVLDDTESVIEDPYPDLKQLLPVDMVTFAYQIADGMEYLSSLGMIHRDLACRNILVGTSKVLKISDFGLARQLTDNLIYYRSTEGKLPIRWMAPEAIKDRTFNTYTDIWSYGVTLWEICTLGAFPYPLLSNRDVLHAVLNGQRLEKPPNCTEDLYEIMLDCWKEDPESRPSFSFLKRKTEEIIQQANQAYPYLDFNLNDYLPYCNLRLTSEAVSTENILEEYQQRKDNEKESSGSQVEEETKHEKEREKESSPTGV